MEINFLLNSSPLAAGAGEVTNLYSVTYNTNGSTGGAVPITQTAESNNETYTFTASAPSDLTRTGHGFIGWSENPNTTTPTYVPGATITLSSSNPSKTLYAVWVNWDTITTMQYMSSEICASANINDSKTLTDTRDGTPYSIKKLSDGKCWMIDNLRIVDKDITSADSDVTSNYTIPASSAPWSSSDGATTNKVHYTNNTAYGAYYSWYTATAGTAPSGTGTASSSICPKGWRLPTGGGSGEFQALVNKGESSWDSTNKGYWFGGTSSATSGAAFFPASGRVYNGSLSNAGSTGFYWSSTAYNASNAYYLNFTSSGVSPSSNSNRYSGLSVRCIAR